MFLNPAGLAYLRKGELRVSVAGGASITKQMAMGDSAYPDVYPSWENDNNVYMTYDSFYGRDVYFDPADYGFPWNQDRSGGLGTYDEAVQAYMKFRDAYSTFEGFINLSDIGVLPRFLLSGGWWSIANISRVSLEMQPGNFNNNDLDNIPINVNINTDGGFIGGLGLKLGPISVGANAKYFTRSIQTYEYLLQDFKDGPPEDLIMDIALGGDEAIEEPHLEVGTGALLAVGALNAGIYIDNLLAFMKEDTINFGAIIDTVNVGVAWTPANNKTAKRRSPLNLAVAADLRNLGSSEFRNFSIGAETGLDLGGILVFNARAGYKQPLPGSLTNMASSFDPRNGTYTLGMQAKFFIFELQLASDFPADLIFDPPSYPLPEDRAAEPFARLRGEISIIF